MIHPGEGDTSTVRSVFIIDPANKVRLTLTYPKSVGRNFDEIVRVIDALQLTDLAPVSTPVDWVPGDRVIVSPMMSTEDARARFDGCRGGQALPPLGRPAERLTRAPAHGRDLRGDTWSRPSRVRVANVAVRSQGGSDARDARDLAPSTS